MFTQKSHAGLKFHFGQNDRYEIHTVLSFISPQFMWTQVKSWLNTEVKFSTEMKSHTGLSPFHLSCECTHSLSLGHSTVMSSFRWQKETAFDFQWKFYCCSTPRRLTRENFVSSFALCLSFVFFSFSFFDLLRPLLQICKVWLTQTTANCTNQVILSNEDMNYLFRA